jgi:tRNA threonylcarbamoyladenosine biosynthesis protein TsaE
MERTISSLHDLHAEAASFLSSLVPRDEAQTYILSGPLGVGKTAFVKEVARLLGVRDVVVSPTFNIMKIYNTEDSKWRRLIHIDAYRLENKEDAVPLKLREIQEDPQTLVLIEWGEYVKDALPLGTPSLCFEYHENGTRSLSYGS